MPQDLAAEDKQIALKIFLTVFLISALFFKPSDLYRFVFLTKAIVHYGTTSIDVVHQESGIPTRDEFSWKGRNYIEINPGLSFLALATYWPYAKTLLPKLKPGSATPFSLEYKLSECVMALSTVLFFSALCVAVFFLVLREQGLSLAKAMFFSFLLYGATPLIFYSLNLNNGQNVLETSLLFSSFSLFAGAQSINRYRVFASGMLCGLATFANMTALLFFPLFLFLAYQLRWSRFGLWLIGAFIGVLPLLVFNWVSFGHPFFTSTVAYALTLPSERAFPRLDFEGGLRTLGLMLVDLRVGLFIFSPFLILLFLSLRNILSHAIYRAIFLATLVYILGVTILFYASALVNPQGEYLFLVFGGGGCRYLLPVLPFWVYLLAFVKYDAPWKRTMVSALFLVSFLINIPGLFWWGGNHGPFNHLVLFLKNGFHSYLIDLIREFLLLKNMNVAGFSVYPALTLLVLLLGWLWLFPRILKKHHG